MLSMPASSLGDRYQFNRFQIIVLLTSLDSADDAEYGDVEANECYQERQEEC